MTPQNSISNSNVPTPSSGSSNGPVRFRDLSDVYEHTVEIELDSDEEELEDSEGQALLVETGEPTCYREAADYQDWKDAMNKEMESIEKNNTWELVKLPVGKRPIGLKWVYKLKRNSDGEVVKYKARLVAKGYVQKHGLTLKKCLLLWPGWTL